MQVCKALSGAFALMLLPHFAAPALAQAWLQETGSYYFKVSASYLSADEEFNFEGDRKPVLNEDGSKMNTSFRDISLTAYLEYGWKDYLTLVASVPYKIVTTMETRASGFRIEPTNGGLGDFLIALRAPLLRKPFVLSVQGGLKLPLGYEQDPDNDGAPLGTGEVDAEFQLLYGQSLWPIPAYISAGFGYRIRGGSGTRDLATVGAIGGLNDEIFYNVEAGYTLGRVFVKLRFDALQSTEDPPDLSGGGSRLEVVAGDQDVYKLTPELDYNFNENFAISTELFHIFAGANTVAGPAVSVAVVFKR